MNRTRLTVVLGVALLAAQGAAAQGLGDVAARERGKRLAGATAGKELRVYTNSDLREEDPAKKKSSTGEEATGPATERAGEVVRDENDRPIQTTGDSAADAMAARRQKVEAAQSARDDAQARVDAVEGRVRELQDQLNPMSPSFVYGQPNAANAPAEEARVRQELAAATAELAAAREGLEAAARALEEVQLGRSPSAER